MIAEPVKKDFVVPQGVTYPIKMRYLDANDVVIDLTGADIHAQLRKQYDQAVADIDCTIANGKAFLDVDNYFGFTLSPADTSAVAATTYFYDLIVTTTSGDVTRAMEGTISITPEVTR
jgi:hypothetical protein